MSTPKTPLKAFSRHSTSCTNTPIVYEVNATAFPTHFRREKPTPLRITPTPESPTILKSASDVPLVPPLSASDDGDEVARGLYAPIPEERKLGHFSTSGLIINRMVGTGIFSKPSAVLRGTGSKGLALVLWVIGAIMSFSGLLVYLEFGILLPYSGGELVYLDEAFPRPYNFAAIVFSFYFIFLGNTAGNCIAFAQYILGVFTDDPNPDSRLQRFVALVTLASICLIHVFSQRIGILLNNILAAYKIALLVFIVLTGFAVLAGAGGGSDREADYGSPELKDAFQGPTENPHDYAVAMLGVLFSYQGFENANYILSEVRRPRNDPSRTYRRAAIFSFCVVSVLYILANVAYFAASSTEDIVDTGTTVAASFFTAVFGDSTFIRRGLKFFISLSALGNLVAVIYSWSRVKQEIARLGIIPFSKFFMRVSRYGTPIGGLILHFSITALIIVVTPNNTANDEAYSIVSNLWIYGHTWVAISLAVGIAGMRFWSAKWRFWKPTVMKMPWHYFAAGIYGVLNFFIIVLMWWPAYGGGVPWFIMPVVGTSIITGAVLYYLGLMKLLWNLGWKLERHTEEMCDGSRVVSFRRYKTGFALEVDRWLSRMGRKS